MRASRAVYFPHSLNMRILLWILGALLLVVIAVIAVFYSNPRLHGDAAAWYFANVTLASAPEELRNAVFILNPQDSGLMTGGKIDHGSKDRGAYVSDAKRAGGGLAALENAATNDSSRIVFDGSEVASEPARAFALSASPDGALLGYLRQSGAGIDPDSFERVIVDRRSGEKQELGQGIGVAFLGEGMLGLLEVGSMTVLGPDEEGGWQKVATWEGTFASYQDYLAQSSDRSLIAKRDPATRELVVYRVDLADVPVLVEMARVSTAVNGERMTALSNDALYTVYSPENGTSVIRRYPLDGSPAASYDVPAPLQVNHFAL